MEPASRTRLIALAVLLAISVPLIVIAAAGGGSDDAGGDGIRIEPSNRGLPEIVIYLEDPDVNTPDTTDGAKRVVIECTDRAGRRRLHGNGALALQRHRRRSLRPARARARGRRDPRLDRPLQAEGHRPRVRGRASYSELTAAAISR